MSFDTEEGREIEGSWVGIYNSWHVFYERNLLFLPL